MKPVEASTQVAGDISSSRAVATVEGTPGARIAWFIFWNLLSFGAMWAIFVAVRDLEWWNGAFHASFAFFSKHATVAVLAALMPFFASLLVGWGYARRARLRRARQAAEAAELAAEVVSPAAMARVGQSSLPA